MDSKKENKNITTNNIMKMLLGGKKSSKNKTVKNKDNTLNKNKIKKGGASCAISPSAVTIDTSKYDAAGTNLTKVNSYIVPDNSIKPLYQSYHGTLITTKDIPGIDTDIGFTYGSNLFPLSTVSKVNMNFNYPIGGYKKKNNSKSINKKVNKK